MDNLHFGAIEVFIEIKAEYMFVAVAVLHIVMCCWGTSVLLFFMVTDITEIPLPVPTHLNLYMFLCALSC